MDIDFFLMAHVDISIALYQKNKQNITIILYKKSDTLTKLLIGTDTRGR